MKQISLKLRLIILKHRGIHAFGDVEINSDRRRNLIEANAIFHSTAVLFQERASGKYRTGRVGTRTYLDTVLMTKNLNFPVVNRTRVMQVIASHVSE